MDPWTVWEGDRIGERLVRAGLAPLSWAFGGGVRARNMLYDRGVLHVSPSAIAAISVGNLTVGGTGKTPVAADIAARLQQAGARPALVLRGYGGDETHVHALLNPTVPVIENPDRVAGCVAARAQGCDVAVLDDAFQHRRAARIADLVLVAAEQWRYGHRLLPAGPYREPVSALARASCVLVTRKVASAEEASAVEQAIAQAAGVPTGRVAFTLGALRPLTGDGPELSLESLRGARVVAVVGIGAPRAFASQLEALGAAVELVSFPDHHPFGAADVARIQARARAADHVVCTLKDAVKLAPHWPRAVGAAWYVSQRLTIESGLAAYEGCLRRVLEARSSTVAPSLRGAAHAP